MADAYTDPKLSDDAVMHPSVASGVSTQPPAHVDLVRDEKLTLTWGDGSASTYPVAYLRRMSPSADMKQLREEMERNPLTVLPSGGATGGVRVEDAELVGNYAIKFRFSDGHSSGIYTWDYLRDIDPDRPRPDPPGAPTA